VLNRLGDSLAHWKLPLTRERITFDTTEMQEFGMCAVDYKQVRVRVNAKFDAWQTRFGAKIGNSMKECLRRSSMCAMT